MRVCNMQPYCKWQNCSGILIISCIYFSKFNRLLLRSLALDINFLVRYICHTEDTFMAFLIHMNTLRGRNSFSKVCIFMPLTIGIYKDKIKPRLGLDPGSGAFRGIFLICYQGHEPSDVTTRYKQCRTKFSLMLPWQLLPVRE